MKTIRVEDVINTNEWTADQVAKLQKALDDYQATSEQPLSARDVMMHRDHSNGAAPDGLVSAQDEEAAMDARRLMAYRDAHQGLSPTEWARQGGPR